MYSLIQPLAPLLYLITCSSDGGGPPGSVPPPPQREPAPGGLPATTYHLPSAHSRGLYTWAVSPTQHRHPWESLGHGSSIGLASQYDMNRAGSAFVRILCSTRHTCTYARRGPRPRPRPRPERYIDDTYLAWGTDGGGYLGTEVCWRRSAETDSRFVPVPGVSHWCHAMPCS